MLLKREDRSLPDDKREKFHQQVVTLVLMLKTAEIRRECLEELIRLSSDEQLILVVADRMHQDLLRYIERNELDFENKLVAQMCVRVMQICRCYIKIKSDLEAMVKRLKSLVEESENPPDIQQLIENLGGWSGNDVARILSLLAFRQSVLKSPIKSAASELEFDFTISEFLGHFSLYYTHLVKKNNVEIYEKLPIEIILMDNSVQAGSSDKTRIESNTRYVSLDRLSRFLFNCTFTGDQDHLSYLLTESCIYPSNLLLLLFTSWLHSSYSNHWRCWEALSRALFAIVDIINDIRVVNEESSLVENMMLFDSTSLDDRLLAPSWADIIELIYKSANITSALIAVNMIKSLINKFKLNAKEISELNVITKEPEDGDEEMDIDSPPPQKAAPNAENQSTHSVISADNDWETLHLDKENLSLLTKQLEDLFLLDMLLKSNLCSSEADQQQQASQQQQTHQRKDSYGDVLGALPAKHHSVSLSFILSSGPGIVSEIVARWAVHHKISPELLICSPSADASVLDNADDGTVDIAEESRQLKR